MRPLLLVTTAALLSTTVSAQFGNFFQQAFFGGREQHQQHQHQHQHQQEGRRGQREHKGWHEMHEGYVCPGAIICVPTPADCPCPYPEDTKCVIPDDRERDEGEGPPFVCVRGECDEVLRFSKPL